jgi:hypothetical protein
VKLKEHDGSGEPLKYRKYVLSDETSLADTHPVGSPAPGAGGTGGAPGDAPRADGSIRPAAVASVPPGRWQEQGAHGPYDPEAIEIPGTHVPVWMVIGIVIGVIVLLAGTAFLLLR